jgi:hypothetical protein
MLRNGCWPTTFHKSTVGDANEWCLSFGQCNQTLRILQDVLDENRPLRPPLDIICSNLDERFSKLSLESILKHVI